MSVDRHPSTGRNPWPTWPGPGAPASAEDWRRQSRQSTFVRPSLVRSAAIVGAAFVASRLLGLVREVVLARQFGTSPELSAYLSAFRIPDLLFLIVMAGSFGSAFIPVFAGMVGAGRDRDAWRLASVVLNLSALVLAVTAALAWIFAGPIVATVVAPGAPAAIQTVATDCMRLLLLSPVFLGLGIAAKGILEGHERFVLPAVAPVLYNVATILGALLLGPRFGVYGVAVGVVVGAVAHLAVQVPGLVRAGMRYAPSLDLSTDGLGDVGRLLLPRLIGQAAFQINFIAVTNLAWRTGEESVAALNYAWGLLMLPHGVLALSISTVVFPTMARLFQAGDLAGLRSTFGKALRPLVFLSVPAAIGLFFFRTAIVQTIFQDGAFGGESTRLVVAPLGWFAIGLLGYATAEVLTRAFYAMHDTVTPVGAGIATIALNIALGVALVGQYGEAALAFALSLSTAVESLILFVIFTKRLGGPGSRGVRWCIKVTVAGLAMGATAWFVAPPVTAAVTPGVTHRPVQIALFAFAIAVTGATYLVTAYLLRIPELEQVGAQLLSKWPRRLKPNERWARRAQRRSSWSPADDQGAADS